MNWLFYSTVWCMPVFCSAAEITFLIIHASIEFGALMHMLKDTLYYSFINSYFGVNLINITLIDILRFFVYQI